MLEVGEEWRLNITPLKLKSLGGDPPNAEVPTGTLSLYCNVSGGVSKLYYKDDAGNVKDLSGGLTGTGVATRVAFWTAATVLGSDADMTFATDTLTVTKLRSTNIGANQVPGALALEVTPLADDFLDGLAIRAFTSGSTRYGVITHRLGGLFFTAVDSSALDSDHVIAFRQHTTTGPSFREIARFGVTGGLSVDDTGLSMPLGVINAKVGFRQGNAAASGNVLKGDGTNFVSAAAANVTAGSSKISLGGTPTAAVLNAFSIDVVEANLTHNNLGGLTTGDPHTQYALLAGRSGGQTLIGGTAATDILDLKGSSNADTGPVRITGSITSSSSARRGLLVNPTFDGAGEQPQGTMIAPTFSPSSSINFAFSFLSNPIWAPGLGVTIGEATALNFQPTFANVSGAITNSHLIYVRDPIFSGALKPTNNYGVRIGNMGQSGINLATALYIEAQSGSTTNRGIICDHTYNWLARTALGPAVFSPTYTLETRGTITTGFTWVCDTTLTAGGDSEVAILGTHSVTTAGSYIQRGLFMHPLWSPGAGVTFTRAEVLEFALRTGSTGGAITDLQGVVIGVSGYGTVKPTTVSGLYIFNIGASGITTAQCLFLTAPSGATNNAYIGFSAADATDPTGGGGAAAGRLAIFVAGTLRYLAYY